MLLKYLSKLRSESGFWLVIASGLILGGFFVPPVVILSFGSLSLYLPGFLFTAGLVLLFAPPSEKRSLTYFIDKALQSRRNRYRGGFHDHGGPLDE